MLSVDVIAASETLPQPGAVIVATALRDARADQSLDPALLLELDELLLDPVRLDGGDVSRLRVLPWLDAAQIEALAVATPPASAAELAALPGWNPDRARWTRAFVRFAAGPVVRRNTADGALRAAALRTRRDVRVDASHGPLRLVARWTSARREPVGRCLSVATTTLRFMAGDVRMRHAQGLLWWSGEERLRAASSVLRAASGVLPHTSLDAERAVRGVALETRRLVQTRLIVGTTVHGRVTCGTLALPAGRFGHIDVGVLRRRAQAWWGVGWSRRSPRAQVALEIATGAGRTAALAAAAWRAPQFSVRGRLEHADALALSPWSVAGPTRRRNESRQGLLQVQVRRRRTRLEIATAHAARRDSTGARLWSSEHAANVVWSRRGLDVELRLRQRARHERAVGFEDFTASVDSRTRSVVVRARRSLGSATWGALEYRGVEQHTLAAMRSDTGSAWVVQLEHRLGALASRWIVTSFNAPSGRAAPYVPDPYVAGTFSSVRVLGQGIRIATGIAWGERRLRLRARAGCVFTRSGRSGIDVVSSLSLRLR